jgi:hypothetical protein
MILQTILWGVAAKPPEGTEDTSPHAAALKGNF